MKSSKLIVVFSEFYINEQLSFSKKCLFKGLNEISKKVPDDNIFAGAENCEINEKINLDNCDIEIILNAEKEVVLNSISEGVAYDNTLVLYVGEFAMPFGQWLLKDGVFHSGNLLTIISSDKRKVNNNFVLSTISPCEDWQSLDKKQLRSFSLVAFNIDDDDDIPDEFVPGINRLIDGITLMIHITPTTIHMPTTMATIASRNPAIYLFLDKGCPVVPTLLTLDGFTMMLNGGYSRNGEWKDYIKYFQQIDVALISHVGYNNLFGITSLSNNSNEGMKINHLFVPGDINLSDKTVINGGSTSSGLNPLLVDIKVQLNGLINVLRDGGMQYSHLIMKGKSGSPLTANNVKPIQLFHKIGYGSLELIPLCPFEDDVDVKKYSDDWKKGKIPNESSTKCCATSLSMLIMWKPFSTKAAVKRIVYIGSKCCLRKGLPSVVSALLASYDCLRQSEFVPADGLVKKPAGNRKSTPPSSATTKPSSATTKPSSTKVSTGDKVANSPNIGTNIGTTNKKVTEKLARPATVSSTTNTTTHNITKDTSTKRPQTASGSSKAKSTTTTDNNSQILANKSQEAKKIATTGTANKTANTTGNTTAPAAAKKQTTTKKPELKPTTTQVKDINKEHESRKKGHIAKAIVTNGTHKVDDKVHSTDIINGIGGGIASDTNCNIGEILDINKDGDGNKNITTNTTITDTTTLIIHKDDNNDQQHSLINSSHEEEHNDDKLITTGEDNTTRLSDNSKIVAVGTVECAITEHGEADFCDDTPEELSADQMREMGLYDDEDDEKMRAGAGGVTMEGDAGNAAMTNIAHLPMEGSFYGKETLEDVNSDANTHSNWNQPLSLPMPAAPTGKGDSATNSKKTAKCASPIHVDFLCVPSDLDKDDLHYLFESIKFGAVFFQLDKLSDLIVNVEILLEEREKDGNALYDTTIISNIADESYLKWASEHRERLEMCRIKFSNDLSRCNITAGIEGINGGYTSSLTYHGMKWEL